MARQVLQDGEAYGVIRGKINNNFLQLYTEQLTAADVLLKTNNTPYTPINPYHPATKVYVDNAVNGITGVVTVTTAPYVAIKTYKTATALSAALTAAEIEAVLTAAAVTLPLVSNTSFYIQDSSQKFIINFDGTAYWYQALTLAT